MKLKRPEGFMSQPFAANSNPSYKGVGLKGHTGEDYVIGFKKEIKATVTGEVYSILNEFNPNTTKYRAVFQLVDDGEYAYEVSYGHIDSALCEEGQIVKVGQPIATEGNWGTCYVGGKLVTPEEKPSGKGTHLHFQVRKCIKVKKRNKNKTYIRNSEGFVQRDGMFYEVFDNSNGYNGCVDPTQFYTPLPSPTTPLKPKFERDLTIGDRGVDVFDLQQFLKTKGFFKVKPTSYFGKITRTALANFQKENNITPPEGYFGSKTRKFISNL